MHNVIRIHIQNIALYRNWTCKQSVRASTTLQQWGFGGHCLIPGLYYLLFSIFDHTRLLFMTLAPLSQTRVLPCRLSRWSPFVFGIVSWHGPVLHRMLVTVEPTSTATDDPSASYHAFQSRGSNISLRLQLILLFRIVNVRANSTHNRLKVIIVYVHTHCTYVNGGPIPTPLKIKPCF